MPGYTNPQNLNRYSYVTNNPLRYVDPTGHRPDDGCSTLGCSLSQKEKDDDANKLAKLKKEADDRKRRKGNRAHCSGWDNWAWDNVPSAISFDSGWVGQAGIMLEGGGYYQTSYVFNWRSWEVSLLETRAIPFDNSGGFVAFGSPHGLGAARYKGVSLIYGASTNSSLEGRSNLTGANLGIDAIANGGISVEYSQAANQEGAQFIDRVSNRTVDSYSLELTLGANLIPNAFDGSVFLGQSQTNDRSGNLLQAILFSFP